MIRRLEFEETVPGRSRQALRLRLYSVSPAFIPPPGSQLLWRTYQPSFPSSLLFARSRRATSLRLYVGPAIQVSQALPRGDAESDFSALYLLIQILFQVFYISLKCRHIVIRLPSPCRLCNIKFQSRAQLSRHDLSINSNPFLVDFNLEMISFISAVFNYFFN
jgi:hypothetical protein